MLKYEIVDGIAEAVEELWPLDTKGENRGWERSPRCVRSGMRPQHPGQNGPANLILPVPRGYSNADPDTKSEYWRRSGGSRL